MLNSATHAGGSLQPHTTPQHISYPLLWGTNGADSVSASSGRSSRAMEPLLRATRAILHYTAQLFSNLMTKARMFYRF